jgi:hypothetical protein
MTWHPRRLSVYLRRQNLEKWLERPLAGAIVLMAIEKLHHVIFARQFEFLDPFLFQFLFSRQIELIAKAFELVLQLLMFQVKSLELLVMRGVLLNQLFLSAFHLFLPILGR